MFLLGVTGSIAAYKAVALASTLAGEGVDVRVLMTARAKDFVAPLSFEGVSGRPVLDDTRWFAEPMAHIQLTDAAKLMLVAPASANALARLALGLADDVLSTTALAINCPLWVAPAMNTRMWEHPATQQHVVTLQDRGVKVMAPDAGHLACGHTGPGRMAEPEELAKAVRDSGLVT